MADFTLGEFLAQSQRSMGGGLLGRASGPISGYVFGPDFFRKQTYLQISDTFVATYGKKVWDALNNRTVFFNAIKKVDWGPTVGWRLRTDRGSNRSRPVTETGTLPTMDISNYVGVYSNPKTVATTFGVTLKAQSVSGLEGGIGNQLAVEQEAASRDHIKELNQELLLGSWAVADGGGATAFNALPDSHAGYFRPGDTVTFWDDSGNTAMSIGANDDTAPDTISAVTPPNTTTGVVTLLTGPNAACANNDIMVVKSRAGFTSIDDVITQDALVHAYGTQANPGNVDVYNLTTRAAGGYAAGATIVQTTPAAGVTTGTELSLAQIDSCINSVRQNGGEPKLIVTGLDTYDKINQLLQVQQRYADFVDYVVGVGDDRTYPGTRAGFQLATYRGIPVLPDPDITKPADSQATSAALASNIYVLDTDYLEMAIMYPTQYLENRDYFAANALVMRGMFFTLGEFRALRPDVQAKVTGIQV